MLSKFVPSLAVLSALRVSYAAPSDDGLSYALSRAGFATEKVVTAATLGSDSSGHTSYSVVFERHFTMNATATAADTTLTATRLPPCTIHGADHGILAGLTVTLVEGPTDAHLFEIATAAGTEVLTINEDCALGNGYGACTVVEKGAATTFSTVVTATLSSTSSTTASAAPTNGAARAGVVGASVLAGVVAALTILGATV